MKLILIVWIENQATYPKLNILRGKKENFLKLLQKGLCGRSTYDVIKLQTGLEPLKATVFIIQIFAKPEMQPLQFKIYLFLLPTPQTSLYFKRLANVGLGKPKSFFWELVFLPLYL